MSNKNKHTDKNLYIDPYLREDLDYCIERNKKNWDTVFIIDGDEGVGKTTLSWGIGYYFAYQTGKTFNMDNIFFDPDKMIDFALKTTGQVIILDEAALVALGNEWQSKMQRKLVKALMTCRSKNHYWIFNIPKFFKLIEYIAIDRSLLLINVYSPDNLTRGYYCVYGKKKKEFLFEQYRSTRKKKYDQFDYKATYPAYYSKIIDEAAYERKKARDVASVLNDNAKENPAVLKYKKILAKLAELHTKFPITQTDLAKFIGITDRTMREARKNLENSRKL